MSQFLVKSKFFGDDLIVTSPGSGLPAFDVTPGSTTRFIPRGGGEEFTVIRSAGSRFRVATTRGDIGAIVRDPDPRRPGWLVESQGFAGFAQSRGTGGSIGRRAAREARDTAILWFIMPWQNRPRYDVVSAGGTAATITERWTVLPGYRVESTQSWLDPRVLAALAVVITQLG